jgi:hypothetical protein
MTGNLFTGEGINLPKLKEKRNALMRDIRALDEAINALERLEKTGLMGTASNQTKTPPSDGGGFVDISNLTVSEATAVFLTERGSPMKTREIVEELVKRGKTIEAKEPQTSVYSSLKKGLETKSNKIKALGNGLWGLLSWDADMK